MRSCRRTIENNYKIWEIQNKIQAGITNLVLPTIISRFESLFSDVAGRVGVFRISILLHSGTLMKRS